MQENCRKSCKFCTEHKCSVDAIKFLSSKNNTILMQNITLQAPPKREQIIKKISVTNSSLLIEPFRKRA